MKKIYLLMILLISVNCFAQVNLIGTATYKLEISGEVGADGSSCGDDITRGIQWIASKDINNVNKTIVQGSASYPNNGIGLTAQSFDPPIISFKQEDEIEEIFIRTTKRDRGTLGCKSVQYSNASILVTTDYYNRYFNFSDLGLNQSGNIQVSVYPQIDLINPDTNNNIIGTESSIEIPEMKGIDKKYFNWMYHIEGEQERIKVGLSWKWVDIWRSLPIEYQGKNSLDIKCADFLPREAVGKKITMRANINGTTVELFYAKSAPHIELVEDHQTKCFDSKDGRVTVKFSEKLISGEKLTCSVSNYAEDGITIKEVFYSTQEESIVIGDDLKYDIPYDFLKGKYNIKLIGWYEEPNKIGANTYVMDPDHQYDFYVTSPPALDFTVSSTNVRCYGSKDGTITITPTGGARNSHADDYYSLDNGITWIPFFNGKPYTIEGLEPGGYKIKVKDMNGCIAKVQTLVNGNIELGEEKVIEAIILQPLGPIELNYTYIQNPTFFGAFNGKIVAAVTGGTINDNKSYNFKWIKTTGEEFPATTQYNEADKTFNISLENIPAGEYKLTVTDKNYDLATNKTGCSVIESSQYLSEPEKIKIVLVESQSISCNSENFDSGSNEFSDGILTATVTGGTLPYQYVWSKFNIITNKWDVLEEETSNTIQDLSKGTYALNITDANGIVQGTYQKTDLLEAIPTTKEIKEPTKLDYTFISGNVSCYNGNNGWAKVSATGGMAPYTYKWYNVKDGIINENEISQLTAGEYFVEITDKNGCFTKGSIELFEPLSAVEVDYKEIIPPSFSGANDGKIVAEVTGGTPNIDGTYNYEWKNSDGNLQIATAEFKEGKYTITLEGVTANDYLLTIRDKNFNESQNQIINCSILNSAITLNAPEPLKVTFEIMRPISCNASNEFGSDKDVEPNDGQRDESQDGILVAHVTGGTTLAASVNNGLPYYFYWKKQEIDGSWKDLPTIKDSIASNLSHGNYALNIEDRNGIVLGTYVNNKLIEKVDAVQFMEEPPKLSVNITHGDVFCYEGNDGWALANVVGGTPPYDFKWSNEVNVEKNTILKAGEYWVFITDAKGCTTQESVTILQPKAPLLVTYRETLNPTFYKATNGKIVAEITGGTLSLSNSYWYEWKNSKGIIQNAVTSNFNNGVFTLTLNGIPEETYTLNVHDVNYDAAISKSNCTISNSIITLKHPDPLEVTFEIVQGISCNVNNEFGNETDNNPQDNQRDESQDGILTTHVKGGIQLKEDQNNGLPYFYTWKKQQKDGSWQVLKNLSETLENVSEGNYSLNIEDANGIILGTYTNNILIEQKPVVQYMPQPSKLNLTFTKLDASCNNGDDGWAEANVSGGTLPYTYEWTNGESTSKIENCTTGNYFVLVTDAKGCRVQGNIFVGDPKGILTTEQVKSPNCYNGNDGSILLNVTGGNLPYSYLWNTGATTKDLNNLSAGNYEVTITCPDCCIYKKKFTLKDPKPIIVDLGNDRTLCSGQILDLDAKITDENAKYLWTSTNGFTSDQANVSLTESGTYYVKVTSGLGCVAEDEIVVKTSKVSISSEFLLSSQAYLDEEVILVNTSDPFGETTKWTIPEGVKIIDQKEKYITLKFDEIGTYTVALEQTQGECFAVYNKNITVEKRSTMPNVDKASKFIIDFIVTPNPSNGNFKAIINLENDSAINLRLFSTTGQFTTQKKDSGKKKYEVDFNTSFQSGMYILVLETEQQTLVKKIIIY